MSQQCLSSLHPFCKIIFAAKNVASFIAALAGRMSWGLSRILYFSGGGRERGNNCNHDGKCQRRRNQSDAKKGKVSLLLFPSLAKSCLLLQGSAKNIYLECMGKCRYVTSAPHCTALCNIMQYTNFCRTSDRPVMSLIGRRGINPNHVVLSSSPFSFASYTSYTYMRNGIQ